LFEPFNRAASAIRSGLQQPWSANEQTCEAPFVLEAFRALPEGANLVLANSMSIRYADALAGAEGKTVHSYALRGVSGIDGTISHAVGIAAASERPTLLVLGDLAFLHDLTALAAARFAPNLTLLLLNNNGGGIFNFLAVHKVETPEQFEKIHGTPHDLHLSAARDLFGLFWHTVETPDEIAPIMARETARVRIIEVRTDRERNRQAYSELINRLSKEAAKG
jgi:2-succinyl-5-enolpyruvyl-6-hydroxy-3-cyclohexene-1-carboxylate synthase